MKKTKKKIKVRDMKPKKDAKGGGIKPQGAAPTRTFVTGTGKPAVN
jgi:hypothetical protein